MSKRSNDPELRREIARQLQHAIDAKGLTKSQAAELLQVKRQTLWLYLKEKSTPGGEVLKKACELLDMKVHFKDYEFGAAAFGPSSSSGPPVPQQIGLFEVLEDLTSEQLEAKVVGRVGDYFELKVRIKSNAKLGPRNA
jgi:transcriptional regulator with XRE-family HTH domain